MGAKIPSASVTVRAMLTSENLRAEAIVSTVGVPTSVVKTRSHPRAFAGAPPRPWPSEERVDERRDRGAFRQHDQDREQKHGDHDRSQPPLLPDLHEGPKLAEDREPIEEATRGTRHPSSPCLVGPGPRGAGSRRGALFQSSWYRSRQSKSSWNSGWSPFRRIWLPSTSTSMLVRMKQ